MEASQAGFGCSQASCGVSQVKVNILSFAGITIQYNKNPIGYPRAQVVPGIKCICPGAAGHAVERPRLSVEGPGPGSIPQSLQYKILLSHEQYWPDTVFL